jgi:hypothetical protein
MSDDPAVCAGPAIEGGLLAGLDIGAETMKKVEQN